MTENFIFTHLSSFSPFTQFLTNYDTSISGDTGGAPLLLVGTVVAGAPLVHCTLVKQKGQDQVNEQEKDQEMRSRLFVRRWYAGTLVQQKDEFEGTILIEDEDEDQGQHQESTERDTSPALATVGSQCLTKRMKKKIFMSIEVSIEVRSPGYKSQ